jgi:hypothetical protein
LLIGCTSTPKPEKTVILKKEVITSEILPVKSREELELELAARKSLLKEINKFEQTINLEIDKANTPLVIFLPGNMKEKINISVKSGKILLAYIKAIKLDLVDNIQQLEKDLSD